MQTDVEIIYHILVSLFFLYKIQALRQQMQFNMRGFGKKAMKKNQVEPQSILFLI